MRISSTGIGPGQDDLDPSRRTWFLGDGASVPVRVVAARQAFVAWSQAPARGATGCPVVLSSAWLGDPRLRAHVSLERVQDRLAAAPEALEPSLGATGDRLRRQLDPVPSLVAMRIYPGSLVSPRRTRPIGFEFEASGDEVCLVDLPVATGAEALALLGFGEGFRGIDPAFHLTMQRYLSEQLGARLVYVGPRGLEMVLPRALREAPRVAEMASLVLKYAPATAFRNGGTAQALAGRLFGASVLTFCWN